MLGKVMKYEFRACGRLLLPFFAMALILSGLIRLAFTAAPMVWAPLAELLRGFATLGGVVVVIALVLFSFAYVVVRFYQSMVTGEAYLSFTLPVKVSTHLTARLIVGTVYCLVGILLAVLAAIIIIPGFFAFLTSGSIPVSVSGASESIMLSLADIPAGVLWSVLGMLAASALVGTLCNLLYAHVSIAVAPVFTKHRVIGSIAVYLVLSSIESILSMLPFLPLFYNIGPTNSDLVNYLSNWMTDNLFTTMGNLMGPAWVVVGIGLAVNLVFAVIHFFLTKWALSKKLNLE
ncbi:hypothetical protein LJC60_04510 [Ruminococcaceae bacterium OttesenSCG-928-D13]|nr:hypothetical protein [Ruminococcaceae bacterium OttesenSCG-928-D13]